MKNSITNRTNNIYFLFGIVFLFFVWFIASLIIDNPGVLPTIGEVFSELLVILKDIKTYTLLGNTFLKIFMGLLCSFLIGLVLAIVSLISEKIEYFVRPFIVFLKSIPIVAIVMILIIVFFKQNVRFIGTIIASSFVMIPIIYESILLGFKTIDPWVIKAGRIDSQNKFQLISQIYIPLTFPHVLSGLVSSFGMGLKVMVMSEVIMNPNNSIGQLIGLYSSTGDIAIVLAYSLLLLFIVIVIDYILKNINKRINLIEK